jgi:hypothetical protein
MRASTAASNDYHLHPHRDHTPT